MTTYRYRLYVGPTLVKPVAASMRATEMPWQIVVIEGTEHIHFSIDALHEQAARREVGQWLNRAHFESLLYGASQHLQLLGSEKQEGE